MIPAEYDFIIYQYSTLRKPFEMFVDEAETTPFDFSNYTIKAQLRKKDVKIIDFTIELSSLLGADGQFALVLTDEQTAALTESTTYSYHYDVTIEPVGGGEINRLLQGHVMISKGVTHD